MVSFAIYQNKIFENTSIAVIVTNSIVMIFDDPEVPIFVTIENVFLGLYTVEMVIKILALGFIFNEGSYLRDSWNILDFVIVASSLLTLVTSMGGEET